MEKNGFEEKIKTLEDRLARLENFLHISQLPSIPSPKPPPPPLQAAAPAPIPAPPPAPAPADRYEYRAPAPRQRTGNWLGVVAVICFVMAAGFIIKLSIDSGWLTPARQVGLAAMFGLALVGAGLALMRTDREYAGFLPAAGIIVLYASVFAAHRLYALIPFENAIPLSAMVSGLCIWLYTQIREDIYPVTAAVGSYCAPLVLSLGASAEFSVYYYLLCSVGFAVISIWVRSRTLTMISAYLAMLMTAFTGLDLHQDGLTAVLLALNFLVLSGGVYFYTVQHASPLTESESMGFLPVLLFFYAMEYYFIDRLLPGLAPWLSLGFAALLLAIYLAAKKKFPEADLASGSLVLAFVTVVCFHSFYLELLPGDARPWLFVAIVAGLCFPSAAALTGAGKASPLRIPAVGILAVLLIEYLSMTSHLLSGDGGNWLALSAFSVVSLWVLISFRGEELRGSAGYAPLLGAAHFLAVLGLYRLTKDSGSLYVSVSWLVYAVGVITFAFSRKDSAMARSAVFVLAFAAGKALLYDAANAPTVVRIFCLLLTGAALYGSGFFLRKISCWRNEKQAGD